MKTGHAVLFLLLAAAVLRPAEYAPYLHEARTRYTMRRTEDQEVERYFREIAKIREEDLTAAARNYQQFIEKYPEGITPYDGAWVSVPQRVFSLISGDRELRKEYQRLFEASVREQFRKAREARDMAAIEKLVGRYLPTDTGILAAGFLAAWYLDHGDLDNAAFYADMLLTSPLDKGRGRIMIEAIQRLAAAAAAGDAGPVFTLKEFDFSRPVWAGGVETSTVYPHDYQEAILKPTHYSAAFSTRGMFVNTGRDVYCFDRSTGRHAWKPGQFHQVRVPGGIAAFGPGRAMTPAGILLTDGVTVLASLAVAGRQHRIAVFDAAGGKVLHDISGSHITARFLEKGRRFSGGKPFPAWAPVVDRDALIIPLHIVNDQRESCVAVRYNVAQGKVEWIRELFDAQLKDPYGGGFPMESHAVITGPYLCVFSYAGYAGVFRKTDGRLMWERVFLPEGIKDVSAKQTGARFVPVTTPRLILMEGPAAGEVTAFSLFTGREVWRLKAGTPRWGQACGDDIILAADHTDGPRLTRLNAETGAIRWERKGVSGFPGDQRGPILFFTDDQSIVSLDTVSGNMRDEAVPQGCLFPGRLYVRDRLYLINNAGVFAYGRP